MLRTNSRGRGSRRFGSLSFRLLVPLLLVVGGVMAAFAAWSLVHRERTMVADARRETQAYGTALGLALDAAFRDDDRTAVPDIIDRISRQPRVYGVVVYDPTGRQVFGPGASIEGADFSTPEEVRRILASGGTSEFERTQDGVDVYSVVRPITGDDGALVGAFEVLQPLSFVEQEKARTRIRFVLNTAVLLAAVTLLLLWLVRRLVSEPLASFAEAVRELGTGHLDHRVSSSVTISELASVAGELNRMAGGLQTAQAELMRSAEERLTLERQVRQAEKMAMIGQFAAGLAHEIGAPLHVIRGRADLLLGTAERPRPDARHLGIIVEQIDRITRIVRNMLDFARHGEPRRAVMDLVPLVDGVLELVSLEVARAGIECRRSGVPSALIVGDGDQLQQVILNLVLNASQALAQADGDRTIEVRVAHAAEGDGDVVLEVTDSGPGIPAEYRDRIFDPFFTTKSDRSGTGLGLVVARWIVEHHRGELSLVTREGPGTTLEVRLPTYRGEGNGQ